VAVHLLSPAIICSRVAHDRRSIAIAGFQQNPLACVRHPSDGCQCGRAAQRTNIIKLFTIENETNNTTVHDTIQEAEAVASAGRFRNESGLIKLAADWPRAVWSGLGTACQA
jgi:hypothetical protein